MYGAKRSNYGCKGPLRWRPHYHFGAPNIPSLPTRKWHRRLCCHPLTPLHHKSFISFVWKLGRASILKPKKNLHRRRHELAVWQLEYSNYVHRIRIPTRCLIDQWVFRGKHCTRTLLNFHISENLHNFFLWIKVRGPSLGKKVRGPGQLPTLPYPKTATAHVCVCACTCVS